MQKSALISVSDKTGLTELANGLINNNYKILATGNTAKRIKKAGIEVTEIADFTGFPEIMDGRVKTVHPKIFGGILLRRDNEEDQKDAKENDICPIDIVCVNLYPFIKVISKKGVDLSMAIENIDIGGPSLIRAAAKNHKFVSVLTSPDQYEKFIEELSKDEITEETKRKLAVAAFAHTSEYDTYIANYFESRFNLEPKNIRINLPLNQNLRYGENPHQQAGIYGNFSDYFELLHGKELSYNNIFDLVSAVELVEELGDNSCTIIKHSNPAGAATGKDFLDAFKKSLKCDPVSAFGGIVTFTGIIDEKLAEKLNEIFLEVVSATGYSEGALTILKKKKNRRVLKQLKSVKTVKKSLKSIPGGMVVQDWDSMDLIPEKISVPTSKKPDENELEDLYFAWKIAKHTKSNAIVFARNKATLGVGAGQMSRVDSVRLAAMKAKEYKLDLYNSVAASDAFFPFADGLLEIVKNGATSVIQPGGSVRDEEVIDAANKSNISMVFTGIRHFKH